MNFKITQVILHKCLSDFIFPKSKGYSVKERINTTRTIMTKFETFKDFKNQESLDEVYFDLYRQAEPAGRHISKSIKLDNLFENGAPQFDPRQVIKDNKAMIEKLAGNPQNLVQHSMKKKVLFCQFILHKNTSDSGIGLKIIQQISDDLSGEFTII